MPVRTHRWTRADLVNLPDDGNRYEVLDGELLVTPLPSPPHQLIALRLMMRLDPWLQRHDLGIVVGPGAVTFAKNELQPDVVVFPIPVAHLPKKWNRLPRPRLVIEILSPTTSERDLGRKRLAYQRLGVPGYWVIDADERNALVWTPDASEPVVVTDTLRWQPRADVEPLALPLTGILPPSP